MPPTEKDLSVLLKKILDDGPVKTYSADRRVRVQHKGAYICDTLNATFVWEHPFYPYFWIPEDSLSKDVNVQVIKEVKSEDGKSSGQVLKLTGNDPRNGEAWTSDRVIRVAECGDDPSNHASGLSDLVGMVRIESSAMDQWYEEDMPIMVHPKDPFKRVDLLPSMRHIQVTVPNPAKAGETIILADAHNAIHLHETSLPCRYYLPITSLKQEYLRPSDTTSLCPYKGMAEYYSIQLPGVDGQEGLLKDMVWYYRNPTLESAAVVGTACFYHEKCDVWIDGKKLGRPKTHFA